MGTINTLRRDSEIYQVSLDRNMLKNRFTNLPWICVRDADSECHNMYNVQSRYPRFIDQQAETIVERYEMFHSTCSRYSGGLWYYLTTRYVWKLSYRVFFLFGCKRNWKTSSQLTLKKQQQKSDLMLLALPGWLSGWKCSFTNPGWKVAVRPKWLTSNTNQEKRLNPGCW